MRLATIIVAPILGVTIYQLLDANSEDKNLVANYAVVSSCMDQYS